MRDVNKENMQLFEQGLEWDTEILTCSLCGRKVSLDYSISDRGKNLICCDCVYEKFGGYSQAFSEYVQRK